MNTKQKRKPEQIKNNKNPRAQARDFCFLKEDHLLGEHFVKPVFTEFLHFYPCYFDNNNTPNLHFVKFIL
jgi:hypothetical protein